MLSPIGESESARPLALMPPSASYDMLRMPLSTAMLQDEWQHASAQLSRKEPDSH